MTDEEMAEEYIQNGDVFENNKVTIKSVEQAFIAGLKAGRPKWHDLMKDVNDLPLKHQRILCWTSDPWCHNQDGVKKGSHCNVEMGTYMGGGEWYIGCYHTCIPPKAWCEIPKYTEK